MGLEGRERDLLGARDADRLGGCLRQVDHATMGIRAPVVDPHHHRLARLLVRDPDLGAERQGLVGGGQIVGVEPLPVSRLLAVKAGAVPGRNTLPQRLGFLSRGSGDPQRAPEDGGSVSLREIAVELEKAGYLSRSGKPYGATAVARMLGELR